MTADSNNSVPVEHSARPARSLTGSETPKPSDTSERPAPPKPPFALSIGVVGHRPKRLPKKEDDRYDHIEAEVARVLK
jgi:hypothetical protein